MVIYTGKWSLTSFPVQQYMGSWKLSHEEMKFLVQTVRPLRSKHDEDISEAGTDREKWPRGYHLQVSQSTKVLLGKGLSLFRPDLCLSSTQEFSIY